MRVSNPRRLLIAQHVRRVDQVRAGRLAVCAELVVGVVHVASPLIMATMPLRTATA